MSVSNGLSPLVCVVFSVSTACTVGLNAPVLLFGGDYASAQIVPDATLGGESSRVISGTVVLGNSRDRITGGAQRGANLFHSFREFNVNSGQRVYFANPVGVQSIFSRITGGNVSNINGVLGVDGRASLFLLNPNGILFGPNAQLDIRGSFLATTARSFQFADGQEFSAVAPQAVPLLTVNLPVGLQYGAPSNAVGTLRSQGNLAAGQNLTLAATNLDLQGQLQAGQNLTLQAQDTVRIRDSQTQPWIARAGGNLLIQGNQGIDIFALNHPQSGFFAGGDLTLQSAQAVGGDAHFSTGGKFQIIQLNGAPGNLFSPADPVILADGDVSLGNYVGASLHIWAGGSVTLGSVSITDVDTTNFRQEAVTLADGRTVVNINGGAVPTLDVRAGIDWSALGGLPGNAVADGNNGSVNGAGLVLGGNGNASQVSSANITTGDIFNLAGGSNNPGTILLTNQYNPRANLTGNIQTQVISTYGDVVIDSKGGITTGTLDTSSPGLAGNVILNAVGDIRPGNIQAQSFAGPGDGFNAIRLTSRTGAVVLQGATVTNSNADLTGLAGDIFIDAGQGVTVTNSTLQSQGNVGRIFIGSNLTPAQVTISNSTLSTEAQQTFATVGDTADSGTIAIQGRAIAINANSQITTSVGAGITGTSGDISIGYDPDADRVSAATVNLAGATLRTTNLGTGDSGSITIQGNQTVALTGVGGGVGGQVVTRSTGQGNSGQITIAGGETVALTDQTLLSTAEAGLAGDINIRAAAARGTAISITRSNIDAESNNISGTAGNIALIASNRGDIRLQGQGESITTSTFGNPPATGTTLFGGDISLDHYVLDSTTFSRAQSGNIQVDGKAIVLNNQAQILTDAQGTAGGTAGQIRVTGNRLTLDNQSEIAARLLNNEIGSAGTIQGDSGGVAIAIQGDIALNNLSGIRTDVQGTAGGTAGPIAITADNLTLTGVSQITARLLNATANGGNGNPDQINRGNAGDINIAVRGATVLDGTPAVGAVTGGDLSRITSSAFGGTIGNGGSVRLDTGSLRIQNNASISASIGGQGQGGSVDINALGNVSILQAGRLSSAVRAGAIGNGGTIKVTAASLTIAAGGAIEGIVEGSNVTPGLPAGQGNAGTIQLLVSGETNLSGAGAKIANAIGQDARGIGGSIFLETGSLTLDNQAEIDASMSGLGNRAGDIEVNAAGPINLRNGAGITASNQSRALGGLAGDIRLNVKRLNLDTNAFITAETGSGGGGNITVAARDLVLLRRNSVISTTAGNALAGGNGGNITIRTPFIVAVPQENSDIIANAFGGRGGVITIAVNRVFGLQPRSRLSPEQLKAIRTNGISDISASSDVGLDGQVDISALTIDPGQGLTELPVDLIDPSSQIAQGCQPGNTALANRRSEFVITGRGGLPPGVDDAQTGGELAVPWVTGNPSDGAQNPTNGVQNASHGVQNTSDQAQNPSDRTQNAGDRTRNAGDRVQNPSDRAQNPSPSAWNPAHAPGNPNHGARDPSDGVQNPAHGVRPAALPAQLALVEAQGMAIAPDGTIWLTAQTTTAVPQRLGWPAVQCGRSR